MDSLDVVELSIHCQKMILKIMESEDTNDVINDHDFVEHLLEGLFPIQEIRTDGNLRHYSNIHKREAESAARQEAGVPKFIHPNVLRRSMKEWAGTKPMSVGRLEEMLRRTIGNILAEKALQQEFDV